MMTRSVPFIATLAAAATGACGGSVHGAQSAPSDYAPEASGASYGIDYCTDDKKTVVDGPDAVYEQVDGNKALLERARYPATGAPANTLFTNHWTAADGDHYFGWLSGNGWEFILANGKGVRLVYTGVDVADGPDDTTRPTGAPAMRCEMIPIGGKK
jgi:hypothetical protein